MVGEGSPTEAIALQVDGPRDADHGGARRSKEGRRSLCSQDANDRFWHEPEVLASATTSSHFGGQADVHLATLDRQVVTPSVTNVVIRYPCAEPD